MAPAARISEIAASSNPVTFSTSPLCCPTAGGIRGCILYRAAHDDRELTVRVSLPAK
jgi:hypothetical protein